MLSRILLIVLLFMCNFSQTNAQNFPWERPLKMCWSTDGITFGPSSVFQDSSGVPCLTRWNGDTLICTFQWFRAPVGSATWDRVAIKFSYDNGFTWTDPVPIVVNGLPPGYQRPFDPTLTVFNNDSIRIYFSSSDGIPMGLDSTVNTYSARSADGITYDFEPGPRVDEPFNRVIDPAVVYFNNSWHYISPVGSPQQGAYHYLSPDGLNYAPVPPVFSDSMHNWTGNYMVETPNQLRFYGTSPTFIWYNSTSNGGMWNGYVNTNIHGGDPGILKVSNGNYLMVYTGDPNISGINEPVGENLVIYPVPSSDYISILFSPYHDFSYRIYAIDGKEVADGICLTNKINIKNLHPDFYFLEIKFSNRAGKSIIKKFCKD